MTSDRGLAGAYSSSAIKESERLVAALRDEGKEVVPYLLGRKAIAFSSSATVSSRRSGVAPPSARRFERPARSVSALVADFTTPTEEGGIDEVHVVFTRFVSMVTQEPEVIRLLPLEVVEGDEAPDADVLLPLYSLRARRRAGAGRAAAEVRQRPALQLHAPGRGIRAGRAPAGR